VLSYRPCSPAARRTSSYLDREKIGSDAGAPQPTDSCVSDSRIGADPWLPETLPPWTKANGADLLSTDGETAQQPPPTRLRQQPSHLPRQHPAPP